MKATFTLARCYAGGFGVKKDIDMFVKLHTELAERGFAKSAFVLGERAFENFRYDEAFRYFSKGAELDNVFCQYYLGECYMFGHGVRKDETEALKWYKKAADLYPADYRTASNVAAILFNEGKADAAKDYITKALRANSNAPEANANLGLISLLNGDVATAENYIAKATGANGLNNVLGSLNIAKGNYAEAAKNLKDSFNNTAALAEILNKNYATAEVVLNGIKNRDAMTDYLQAIRTARQGNTGAAASFLKNAIQKDPKLASYAANDLELLNVSK